MALAAATRAAAGDLEFLHTVSSVLSAFEAHLAGLELDFLQLLRLAAGVPCAPCSPFSPFEHPATAIKATIAMPATEMRIRSSPRVDRHQIIRTVSSAAA